MENDIKISKAKIIQKSIKTTIFLVIGIIPFIWGLQYSLTESDSYINMIIGGLLSMSASLILMGFMHHKKEHGGGILSGLGMLCAIASGVVYFGNSIIHMIG